MGEIKKTGLKTLLEKEMSRKEFLTFSSLVFVSLFGVTRVIKELVTHATASNASSKTKASTTALSTVTALIPLTPTGGKNAMVATAIKTPNAAPSSTVPNVIFDSDMSSDYDDIGDIAVLEGLNMLGECKIIGMAVSSTNGGTAPCMDAINTYYGIPGIPIGNRPDVQGSGAYPAQIASEFPHAQTTFPLAKDMYRKALAAAPDSSVIIVTAGFLDNLQALMQSGADQYSSLSGIDLIKQKVKLLACAGGGYPAGGEFNFTVSPSAAQYVINNWPTAATFSPDNVGRYYYTGRTLVQTPNNPIRRVYVDIEGNTTGYPSWTQVGILQAIRGNTGLFGLVTTGSNTVAANGTNQWVASPDPSGAQDQAYIVERSRIPVTDSLNALMTVLPASIATNLNVPGAPSDLKASVVSGGQINLSWIRNSYNETSFVIEQQTASTSFTQTGAVGSAAYTQIGTVGAGVTNFSLTGLSTTANLGFRVKAVNAAGSSYVYSYVWLYSGWTEYNFSSPGQNLPLYTYYQTCDLRWSKGGDYTVDHVALNNDSSHDKNLIVNVLAAAQGAQGGMFIYFFYQDQNNWYRLNFDNGGEVINDPNGNLCWFEKSVGGTISQIGSKVSTSSYNLGSGAQLAPWQVAVTAAGNLNFFVNGSQLLSVTDSMSFTTGKIGLGGKGITPVWENFNFWTSGGSTGSAPSAPTGLSATAGTNQVALTWSGVSTATSYNIYRGTTAGGESSTPIATGVTSTTYTDNVTASSSNVVKIMALGDSITDGYQYQPSEGGYRITLWQKLVQQDHDNIDFVGSLQSGPSTLGDRDMEGHDGWTISTPNSTGVLSQHIDGWLATYKPDVILLHAGTNDIGNGATGAQVSSGLDGFLGQIFTDLPNVKVIVAQIIPSITTYQPTLDAQQAYHDAIPGLVTKYINQGRSIQAIDMSNLLNSSTDYADTLHPNNQGYDKMGAAWYPAVAAVYQSMTTGTKYYYTVKALNTYGTSASSNEVSATPMASGSAPSAPTGLSATAGTNQVALTWSGVSTATSYNIYRGTTAGGESSTPIATGVTAASYTNTGLTAGTKYYYTVKALNTYGTSASSNEASAMPTSGGSAPSAPTNLVGSAGNAQSVLSWNTVSTATSYNIYRGTTAGGESTTPIANGLTTASYTDTGLTAGIKYYYTVRALNSYGTSSSSNEVVVTPTSGGTGSATFINPSFETPLVSGYSYNPTGSGWAFTNNAGIQQNGSAYSYGNIVAPDGTQTALLQGISGTLGTMSQSVNFPAGNYTISFYAAQRYGQIQPVRVNVDSMTVGTYTPTSNNFIQITTASFTVTAGNHTVSFAATDSTGDNTTFIDLVTLTSGGSTGSAPSAPTGLSATAGTNQVALTWSGVSTATSYNIYRGTTAGGESTTPIANGLTTASYTDTGLTAGIKYYYTVKALNSYGTSASSNEASATPTGSAPAAPVNLLATASNAQVALNWNTVSTATSYNIYRGTTAGGESTTPIANGLTTASYTDTGLTAGIKYYYTVKALNSYGTSASSNEASATPTGGGSGSAMFTNPSFETPAISSYSYSPSGSGWTFTNSAGIQHNGSAYSYSSIIAPDGTQTALLQGISGTLGTMSQSVNFPAGNYTISFYAAQRYGQIQPVKVTVDSTVVGTYTPTSSSFAQLTTASFTVTAGNHMVSFAATDSTGDNTTFIDVVSIASA